MVQGAITELINSPVMRVLSFSDIPKTHEPVALIDVQIGSLRHDVNNEVQKTVRPRCTPIPEK